MSPTSTGAPAAATNPWTNFFGNLTCQPSRTANPISETDVQKAVAGARNNGEELRVVGGGHSLPPVVPTSGTLLDLAALDGELRVDRDALTATIPAGRTLRSIFNPLWDAGVALKNMGELADGTIAGAISTGAHGTGIDLQCTSASLVHARLALASGDIIEVSREQDENLLRAAQVSLGMLGVLTEVTIEVAPAYDLQEVAGTMDLDQVLDQWDDLVASHRHFSFYYIPNDTARRAFAEQLEHLPSTGGEGCYVSRIDAVTPDVPREDLGPHSHRDRMDRVLTIDFDPNYREIEYAVPLEAGKDTFLEMRDLIGSSFPEYAYPINVRFVAGDDAFLSAYSGGPRVVFSVSEDPEADYASTLAPIEELFLGRGGRPHWGKEHALSQADTSRLFPDLDKFATVRRDLDPAGLFLNDHVRELFL